MASVRNQREKERLSRTTRLVVRVVVPVVFALGLWYILTHVARLGYVFSASMEPALQKGDYYTIRLDAYNSRPPGRGEIIVYTDREGDPYVKRVIALPGEKVLIWRGTVLIDGEPLREPYLKERPQPEWHIGDVVPEDYYVVLGDNRNFSSDSRDSGYVRRGSIMGRVTRIVWPLDRAQRLTAPSY